MPYYFNISTINTRNIIVNSIKNAQGMITVFDSRTLLTVRKNHRPADNIKIIAKTLYDILG